MTCAQKRIVQLCTIIRINQCLIRGSLPSRAQTAEKPGGGGGINGRAEDGVAADMAAAALLAAGLLALVEGFVFGDANLELSQLVAVVELRKAAGPSGAEE